MCCAASKHSSLGRALSNVQFVLFHFVNKMRQMGHIGECNLQRAIVAQLSGFCMPKLTRIAAQLIDATTGHHAWAETYDSELRDIFQLQDEISQAIVGSMHPELQRLEQERAVGRDPETLDAWDCVMRAWWHFNRHTKDDNAKARFLYGRAVELDPHAAIAFAGIAFSQYQNLFLHS